MGLRQKKAPFWHKICLIMGGVLFIMDMKGEKDATNNLRAALSKIKKEKSPGECSLKFIISI